MAVARTLSVDARVVILDESTEGIDIGSKAVVHDLMSELAGQGLAVITVSSEIPEILGMSDRVNLMRKGPHCGRRDDPRDAGARRPGPRPRGGRMSILGSREAVAALAILELIVGRFPGSLLPAGLARVLTDAAPLILLDFGRMVVIATRRNDLSVAATLAPCGMVAALMGGAILPAVIALGAALGAANGVPSGRQASPRSWSRAGRWRSIAVRSFCARTAPGSTPTN